MLDVVGSIFHPCLGASAAEHPLKALARATVVPGEIDLGRTLGRVPCDLYVWPGKRSYTGQPAAEFHTIGAPPVLDAVVRASCEAGARLALGGEFTMRAFLAGRLDLTQAEAVLGVIDSQSQQELQVSLRQLAGGLSAPLHQLREDLINLLADVEAGLDFVEEDIEFITSDKLASDLDAILQTVQAIQRQLTTRGQAGSDRRVVLVGLPNAGKSSLLNALANASAAIVSPSAGTTRDYVTRPLLLDGLAVTLVDTAGIEFAEHSGAIAAHTQRATSRQHDEATLTLLCLDGTRPLDPWEMRQLDESAPGLRLVVVTKCDAGTIAEAPAHALRTSSVTLEGIAELRSAIRNALAVRGEAVASTVSRCHDSLRLASASLQRAGEAARQSMGNELVAAEVRVVLEELGKVVGSVYTEDILDRIFSRFCIGK
jgi:tRNA modification GTPase